MSSNTSNAKSLVEDFFNLSSNEETLEKESEKFIEILKKFCNLLNSADRFKKDVFLNLSDRGLNKLLSLLKDNNENIRKLSFKVLILLLNKSEILQNIFCEKFNFNPIGNVIVINWLPSDLKNAITFNAHTLYEIKKTQNDNLDGKKVFWQWPPNEKYNIENLPDPKKYLLGIYCSNQNKIHMEEMKFDEEFNIDEIISKIES